MKNSLTDGERISDSNGKSGSTEGIGTGPYARIRQNLTPKEMS